MLTQVVTKSRIAVAVASFSLMALAVQAAHAEDACTPKHKFETVTPGVLTVALDTAPPFGYVNSDKEYKGAEAEVLKKFAADECLKVNAMVMNASAAIQYVVSGRADVTASGWFMTRDRAKVLNYAQPMYVDMNAVYSKEGWTNLSQLDGKNVGTVQGYLFVSDLQKIFGSKLKLYPSVSAVVQDLHSGRVDAALITTTIGASLKSQGALDGIQVKVIDPDNRVPSTLEPAQIGMMYGKSNDALGTALNAKISELRSAGELEVIAKQYSLTGADVSNGEAKFIQ